MHIGSHTVVYPVEGHERIDSLRLIHRIQEYISQRKKKGCKYWCVLDWAQAMYEDTVLLRQVCNNVYIILEKY